MFRDSLGRSVSTALLGSPVILGGPVQVDESLFWHKPKMISHNIDKLHDNIMTYPSSVPSWSCNQQWGLGLVMVDTSHIAALGYMCVVARRNAATLLPIIQNHVAPGSIIHSDHGSRLAHFQQWFLMGLWTTTLNLWTQHQGYIQGAMKVSLPATWTSFMWREWHGQSTVFVS